MKKTVILGQANVGKTLFLINFARFLGLKKLGFTFCSPEGGSYSREFLLDEARRALVSSEPHHTRGLQSIVVRVPWGKHGQYVELVDSTGLGEGIHGERTVRKAMAQSLGAVRQSDIILHMVDTSLVASGKIGEIDRQIAHFGHLKPGYAILGNKVDLPHGNEGLALVRKEFPHVEVIKISALKREGFEEVKGFVRRHL